MKKRVSALTAFEISGNKNRIKLKKEIAFFAASLNFMNSFVLCG